jgi:hypothetical protein
MPVNQSASASAAPIVNVTDIRTAMATSLWLPLREFGDGRQHCTLEFRGCLLNSYSIELAVSADSPCRFDLGRFSCCSDCNDVEFLRSTEFEAVVNVTVNHVDLPAESGTIHLDTLLLDSVALGSTTTLRTAVELKGQACGRCGKVRVS